MRKNQRRTIILVFLLAVDILLISIFIINYDPNEPFLVKFKPYGYDFCRDNHSHSLSNVSGASFWLEGVLDQDDVCCTNMGGGYSYERADGTITRFLFGSHATGERKVCVWVNE